MAEQGSKSKLTGSKARSHAPAETLPVVLAPSTTGKNYNKIRKPLISVACWKLESVRFAFGSSFILPDTQKDFAAFSAIRKAHPSAPMSVFGHADPVGDDAFNKKISGHRAESIYAVLTHDTARWEQLYQDAGSSEGWGSGAVRSMLSALGFADVTSFQTANGLTADGVAGPKTREKLFAAYMRFLLPTKVEKTDFLSQGKDAKGKGDVQGCGEFNPLMVFSKAEMAAFQQSGDRSARDAENVVNRRVLVLFFEPGTVVNPDAWPCPRSSEGTGGCQKRFWSDGDKRRGAQEERREFGQSKDTFACRFYQRVAGESPCEAGGKVALEIIVRLQLDDDDPDHSDDEFTLTDAGGGYRLVKKAESGGGEMVELRYPNVQLGVRYTLTVKPGAGRPDYTIFENLTYEEIKEMGS